MPAASPGLLTLFHTVRHLKPVQVYRRLWRARAGVPLLQPAERRPSAATWTPAIHREPTRTGPFRFRFLNQERELRGWNDAGVPKLWLYNLHYFEAPDCELIQRWIEENPPGIGNGWEPYPLSLRIVNWIKWELAGNTLTAEALASLAIQAEYLSHTVEYHLLANHLFENAKALVFAGLFFKADTWLRMGLDILQKQVPEQVLSDGGHFERSPMYHSLVLEDILDLINLGRAYGLPEQTAWADAAQRMLGWLEQMCHPDGQIAFFNDAAFGVAPEPRAIFDYGARLGLTASSSGLGESGYIRLQQGATVVIFDAAPVGPDYQPGHSHADTLSFEMSHAGKRVIVNSGTGTYEPGPERLRQRGTAAHSTAVVDARNQSEVWSAFRLGRRARPLDVSTDHKTFAEAAHDGYRPLIHHRHLELEHGRLTIQDAFTGPRATHEIEIFFHLHPEAKPGIQLDPKLVCRREPGTWHPGFNLAVPNQSIVGHYHGPVPVTFQSIVATQ